MVLTTAVKRRTTTIIITLSSLFFSPISLTNCFLISSSSSSSSSLPSLSSTKCHYQSTTTTTTMSLSASKEVTNNNNEHGNDKSWSIQNENDVKTVKEKLHVWPLDEYNIKLLNEVHPKNWSNKDKMKHLNDEEVLEYDFIALGAGAGGLVSSRQAARRGAKSAMISSNLAGGDCLNVGCVPSKALIRSARLIREVRKAQRQKLNQNCEVKDDDDDDFGVKIHGYVEVDFPQIMKRMRKLRSDIAPIDGHERGKDIGVDVYQGFGRFVSKNTIEVLSDETTENYSDDDDGNEGIKKKTIKLKFKKLAICTGGRAYIPSNIPGLDKAPFTTNETLFNLTKLPKQMIILGSGVVALEMAQTFATFGSKVTVLVRGDKLFPKSDPDAGPFLMDSLKKSAGVSFITKAKITNVTTLKSVADGDEESLPLMKVSIDSDGNVSHLECECLLVAAGRVPNVEKLNLDAANICFDVNRGVLVDDDAKSTTNPDVYSVGDCTANVPRLTHMSGEMAKVVVQNSLFNDEWKLSSLVVPSCMYTEPEFATVGDVSASYNDPNVDIYKTSLDHNDRSILDGDREGYAKVFCRKGTGTIIGCSIIGSRAGEIINEASLAMKHNIPLEGIGRNIHCYPTTGESLMSCGLQLINSKWKRFDEK